MCAECSVHVCAGYSVIIQDCPELVEVTSRGRLSRDKVCDLPCALSCDLHLTLCFVM